MTRSATISADAAGLRIAVLVSRYHTEITDALEKGARSAFEAAGGDPGMLEVFDSPGAFELAGLASVALETGRFDAVVCLGCVIRGETDHYDHICREVSRKLMDLSVDYEMPHGFGILTCENKDQAWERADTAQLNLGGRTAAACLRMIDIKSGFPD